MDALIAVQDAICAVRKTAPHGRDYYPQGEGAIIQAMQEHSKWMQDLEAMRLVLEDLACATMPT
jgi:hypothetical protein